MSISDILEIKEHQIAEKQKILDNYKVFEIPRYILPLGAKNFDETIGGGFSQGKKYLIFGENKTGKTQLCHQLCVQAYIHSSSSAKTHKTLNKQSIFYFDIENTFRPERLKELIITRSIDYNKLLQNIYVTKIMSNSALLLSLNELETYLEMDNISLLIIDTINNHYNSEIANKQISTSKTRDKFLKILYKINELTLKYNLITIVTAQVTSNLNIESLIRVRPVGNHLLNQFFSEYIYLDFKERDKRYVQLVNSMSLPEKRLLYKITSLGIQDYKI
jgi:RecA/RadA recombinase